MEEAEDDCTQYSLLNKETILKLYTLVNIQTR